MGRGICQHLLKHLSSLPLNNELPRYSPRYIFEGMFFVRGVAGSLISRGASLPNFQAFATRGVEVYGNQMLFWMPLSQGPNDGRVGKRS